MATYTISHTLQTSTSYPAAEFSSTFAPLTSVYFKLDDTIQATVSHPVSGNTLGISLNDVNEANPDPSNLGGTTTHADDYTYSLTWSGTFAEGGAASADFFTQWFHFNRTGTFQYSAKSVFRRVAIASLSMGSTSIVAGNSTTITAGTISGLLPPTGNNAHRLYLYVTDTSDNMLFGNGPTFSVSGNNTWLGKFTTTQMTNTMTVGSGVSAGDYRLHVGHYGGGGSGNVFYGSDHRLTSVNFSVTAPAGDTTPNAFQSSLFPTSTTYTNQAPSTVLSTPVVQLSGTDTATSIAVNSGTTSGTPEYRTASTSNGVASASYTTTAGNIDPGHFFQMRYTTHPNYGTSNSVTPQLTIGTVSGSQQVSNAAAATGGSGSGTTGSLSYGIKVVNSGQTSIYGVDARTTHVIKTGTVQLVGTNGTTITGLEGFSSTSGNENTHLILFVPEGNTNNANISSGSITIIRGTNQVTISKGGANTLNFRYYALRY